MARELGQPPADLITGGRDSESVGGGGSSGGGGGGAGANAARAGLFGAPRSRRTVAVAVAAAAAAAIACGGKTASGRTSRKPLRAIPATEAPPPTPADAAEGFTRTLYVVNVAVDERRKHVVRLFAPYGPVKSVRLRPFAAAEAKLPKRAAIATGALHTSRDTLAADVVLGRERGADGATAAAVACAAAVCAVGD